MRSRSQQDEGRVEISGDHHRGGYGEHIFLFFIILISIPFF
jgi:hypothetical protein